MLERGYQTVRKISIFMAIADLDKNIGSRRHENRGKAGKVRRHRNAYWLIEELYISVRSKHPVLVMVDTETDWSTIKL